MYGYVIIYKAIYIYIHMHTYRLICRRKEMHHKFIYLIKGNRLYNDIP